MFQEILNLLKTKYDGVQESILSRVAKKLAETATTSEEAKNAVDGIGFQQLLESYGDSRATDATKTAVLNYERKHNIKDGKPVAAEPKQTEQTTTEEAPAWAKAMMDTVKNLTKDIAAIKGEKLTATRRQRLNDTIQTLPQAMRRAYDRINVEGYSDEDFDTLLAEIKTEVGEIAKTTSQRGAVFGKPTASIGSSASTAGTTTTATKDEVDAVVARINI